MLRFILGTAGTGKTSKIIEEIGNDLISEQKVILLVPEQFSFESERRIYKQFGEKSSLYAEVLSFTRLSNNIFRKFGGLAGVPITKTGKYLLMSTAISELEGRLQVYRKSSQNTAFIETMLQVCSEFKTAGVTPFTLEKFLAEQTESGLTQKLRDLSLVYSTYQALLQQGYSDSEDDVIRACEVLENNDYFGEFNVYIDGFTTFMAGEFEFLGHIIKQAKKTMFAMTTDSKGEGKGSPVYSVVEKAVKQLERMAASNGAEIMEPLFLHQPLRYKRDELSFLSQQFLKPDPKKFDGAQEGVKYTEARDYYKEITMVGAEIARLVREEGFRYKEIGIIGRSPEDYHHIFRMVLPKYNIPYFTDETLIVENTVLFSAVLSALKAVQNNFDLESVIAFGKSPIMGADLLKTAALENYCYMWGVRGGLWHSDFANNPRGMAENFSEKEKAALAEINRERERVVAPLKNLKETILGGDGLSFAKGIYNLLVETMAGENLRQYGAGLSEEEALRTLTLNGQLWDSMMEVLDVFGSVLGSRSLGVRRLIELFSLAVNSTEIGIIPQTLDQVIVGGADRIRPGQLKAVFVIGSNEGVFPASPSSGGVFSQRERTALIDGGIPVTSNSIEQAMLERFFAYFAVTLPSHRLYVSSVSSDIKGQKMLPSAIVKSLGSIFGDSLNQSLQQEPQVQTELSALEQLAENFRADSVLRATLYNYFRADKKELLSKMEKAAWKSIHNISREELAAQLFGKKMYLSPSKVERFNKCGFSYFVQDGLKLEKRKKVDFSPLESGSLIHHVLQVMLQKYGGKGLSELTLKEIETEVSEIIYAYIETRVEDREQLSVRTGFLFSRLFSTLAKLIEHMGREFAQSQYRPAAFEMPIKRGEMVEPLELITPDGKSITVEGIVDRVDVMEEKGKKYIRVVDYKSGSKKFRLDDVLYGLNLQMLLYLFTIQEQGTGALEGGVAAGVLYMPIKESYNIVERTVSDGQAKAELAKQWTMSGILLDDEDALKGMEEDLGGLFIPATLKKDGSLSAVSSVVSNSQLGMLSRKVKKEILKVAEELSKGKIPANPIDDVDYPTCKYCDYKEVCGYEEGDPVRKLDRMSNREVMERLEEEELA